MKKYYNTREGNLSVGNHTKDAITDDPGKTPITDQVLLEEGFRRLENGQYELHEKGRDFLCFFRADGVISLKSLQKSVPLSLRYGGYHHTTIDDQVDSLEKLRKLLST